MTWWIALGVAGLTGGLTYGINRGLLATGWLLGVDKPNQRSLHRIPTPVGGGLGMLLALALAGALSLVVGAPSTWLLLAGPALAVALISYWDDRASLPAGVRLAVHFGCAGWLLLGLGWLDAVRLPGVELPLGPAAGCMLTVLGLVWMTNLFNFMDGMDGFAAGMTAIGFAALATLSLRAGHVELASLGYALAGAGAGFGLLNYPPARLFMGDVGASTVGFIAGAYIVWADLAGVCPAWVGVLVFSPFIVDATVTLVRRGFRGERVWEAHRSHYYQRLVQLGWGHERTVWAEYVLMLSCAAAALSVGGLPVAAQWGVLGVWLLVLFALMRAVGRLEHRAKSPPVA